MKKIKIDVMLNGGCKFYKTLQYQYNPLFEVTFEDIARFAVNELPSLKNRKEVELVVY